MTDFPAPRAPRRLRALQAMYDGDWELYRHFRRYLLITVAWAAVAICGSFLVGGSAAGVEDAAGMGNMLLALSYGREAESEADATALVILNGTGINADSLNRFFRKLEKMGDLGGVMPSWLSTHPPTSERIQATAGAAGAAPALSPADWLMLKGICGN